MRYLADAIAIVLLLASATTSLEVRHANPCPGSSEKHDSNAAEWQNFTVHMQLLQLVGPCSGSSDLASTVVKLLHKLEQIVHDQRARTRRALQFATDCVADAACMKGEVTCLLRSMFPAVPAGAHGNCQVRYDRTLKPRSPDLHVPLNSTNRDSNLCPGCVSLLRIRVHLILVPWISHLKLSIHNGRD